MIEQMSLLGSTTEIQYIQNDRTNVSSWVDNGVRVHTEL